MLFRDNFLYGFLWGTLLPAAGFALFYFVNQAIVDKSLISADFMGFKDSTIGIMALCLIIAPAAYANKRLLDNFVRGLMVAMVIVAGIWFYFYGWDLLQRT